MGRGGRGFGSDAVSQPGPAVGTEAVTMFCRNADGVIELLRSAGAVVPQAKWASVTVQSPAGQVHVNKREFAPASEFSGVVLGMTNLLRQRGQDIMPGGISTTVPVIDACDVILGIVLDPALRDADERGELLTALSLALEAVAFDGQTLFGPTWQSLALIV